MNLLLTRKDRRLDGIFGEIQKEDRTFLFHCLEHAYLQEDGTILSKIPDGKYICKRGPHKLYDKIKNIFIDIDTFEVTGITGHFGIVFHVGNYNRDSDGCCLLGMSIGNALPTGKMLVRSKDAFKAFMKLQEGNDMFELTVESIA